MSSGWTLSGVVTYASGSPLSFYSPNIYNYYPGWAAIYVNYNLGNYKGRTFDPGDFTPPTSGNPAPRGICIFLLPWSPTLLTANWDRSFPHRCPARIRNEQ